MFKMGCMARKILAPGSAAHENSAAAGRPSSEAAKKNKKDNGQPAPKSTDELGDFSKLEDDPRLPLNKRQIFKITKSWKAIARTMSKTGTAMFLNLFEQNQDLFYLFDRFQHLKGPELHESMELREHAATVMSTLDQSINSLSDYDNFVTYLHSIGQLHRKVPGFKRDYFWKIELPFMKAVKRTLDERCNETIEEIYTIAIKLIIETIADGYGFDAPVSSVSGSGGGGGGLAGGSAGPGARAAPDGGRGAGGGDAAAAGGTAKAVTNQATLGGGRGGGGGGGCDHLEWTGASASASQAASLASNDNEPAQGGPERGGGGLQAVASFGGAASAPPAQIEKVEPDASRGQEQRHWAPLGSAEGAALADKQARLLLERLLLLLLHSAERPSSERQPKAIWASQPPGGHNQGAARRLEQALAALFALRHNGLASAQLAALAGAT